MNIAAPGGSLENLRVGNIAWRAALLSCVLLLSTTPLRAQEISLPTENRALFEGRPQDFYQVIDRDFQGQKTTPWEGGQYGFVRDPQGTGSGIVYTRFHEGIDIQPLRRDATGVPLDEVRACADGRIAYTNPAAGASNYGRFVVIEHTWDGCKYFSLYAHLDSISAKTGASIHQGEKIGILGFTGVGIDRRRAHVHFELNLMLSSHFEAWHTRFFPTEINHHGLYNGLNLAGIDIAAFLLARQKNPALSVAAFVTQQPVFYKVILPVRSLDLVKFYPWLLAGGKTGAPALEVWFDRTGLPIKVVPAAGAVAEPTVSWVQPSPISYGSMTRDIITGSGKRRALSASGLRYMSLLMP